MRRAGPVGGQGEEEALVTDSNSSSSEATVVMKGLRKARLNLCPDEAHCLQKRYTCKPYPLYSRFWC